MVTLTLTIWQALSVLHLSASLLITILWDRHNYYLCFFRGNRDVEYISCIKGAVGTWLLVVIRQEYGLWPCIFLRTWNLNLMWTLLIKKKNGNYLEIVKILCRPKKVTLWVSYGFAQPLYNLRSTILEAFQAAKLECFKSKVQGTVIN